MVDTPNKIILYKCNLSQCNCNYFLRTYIVSGCIGIVQTINSQQSTVNSQQSTVNSQQSTSPDGATGIDITQACSVTPPPLLGKVTAETAALRIVLKLA
jgi:hypothetical protein